MEISIFYNPSKDACQSYGCLHSNGRDNSEDGSKPHVSFKITYM